MVVRNKAIRSPSRARSGRLQCTDTTQAGSRASLTDRMSKSNVGYLFYVSPLTYHLKTQVFHNIKRNHRAYVPSISIIFFFVIFIHGIELMLRLYFKNSNVVYMKEGYILNS